MAIKTKINVYFNEYNLLMGSGGVSYLPLVSGIGYEVLKFLAKYQNNLLCKMLSRPGLWLQKITTNEPTN